MTEKQYKVMINEQNKSACILDTQNEKVYMLAFFDNIAEMNNYIVNLNEVVNLLNGDVDN